MRISVETDKVHVSEDFVQPRVLHDKCVIAELDSGMNCAMNDNILECSMAPCGQPKYNCDCNVYHQW